MRYQQEILQVQSLSNIFFNNIDKIVEDVEDNSYLESIICFPDHDIVNGSLSRQCLMKIILSEWI